MHAAIVELDALPDAVRAAAEDEDLLALAGIGLADRGILELVLVGGIEVGREGAKLRRAGIDALEDGMDRTLLAEQLHRGRGHARKPRQPRVREAGALEVGERFAVVGQAVGAHVLLHRHEVGDLAQEPAIHPGRPVDRVHREAEAQRLGDAQEIVGRALAEGLADALLVDRPVRPAGARDLDLVEARQAGLERAQRLLQGLLEGAPDRHHLADRLHRGGEHRLGAGEFLEGEPRHLGDDVVDRRLEGGRRHPGDVVLQLVQAVADRQLGRDLRDRESGGLGGQGRGARDAGIHLDDHHPPGLGMDRELDIGAAGVDADLAQACDRGVAQPLVFLVGQGQGRRDRDRIAGVDAHRVEVLDGADDDAVVGVVANHLHLVLLPAEQRLLDQHLADGREGEAALDRLDQLGARGCDAAAFAAQGEGGTDDRRQADPLDGSQSLIDGADELPARAVDADALHGLAETLAAFRLLDHLGIGADHFDAMALENALCAPAPWPG